MNNTIIHTTVNQQIEKLKNQNLIINNEAFAREMLSLYGYSNIIKSYREPYILTTSTGIKYRSNIAFEQLFSLFILDKNLRSAVMAAMLDFEEHIKEIAANVVCDSFGIHQDDYLNYRNFQNKRKHKSRFSLKNVLKTMNKALDTDRNPIYHYKTIYSTVPPWILFKNIYFSTIVNYIDQFKTKERTEAAKILYSGSREVLNISDDSLGKLMLDTMFICLEYRNTVAHGGRTYNHVCQSTLRSDEIFGVGKVNLGTGFNQLLSLLSIVSYSSPFNQIEFALNNLVNEHCNSYPQDATYLGQVLNIDIVMRNIVHTLPSSERYHANPNCSGMMGSSSIELHEAESKGLSACKRCAQNIIPIV